MDDAQKSLAELIDAINRVFDGVSREDGVTLHEAQVLDDCGTEAERAAARKRDSEGRWQDVPDAEIEDHPGILSFVDLKGWRYYLPAYMVWTLRHYAESGSETADATIYALSPGNAPELKAHSMDRFKTLSASQSASVCRFLRHMCAVAGEAHCDAQVARENLAYWGRFWKG